MSHFVQAFRFGKLLCLTIGILFLVACAQRAETPPAMTMEPTQTATAVANAHSPIVVGTLVSVNTPVTPGESIGASIDVDHPANLEVRYEWTIQSGTSAIIDGQSTNMLLFQAPEEAGNYILSVEVSVGDEIYHRSQLLTVIEPPTPTPTYTPTPTAVAVTPTPTVTATPASSTHAVLVGSQLVEGYGMGVDSSSGQTDWVTDNDGHMCMAYASGQDWGAVFITFGEPTDPPRPGQDLSGYQALSLELRGEAGGEAVWIGLKDSEDADDGQETKLLISGLTEEWQTRTFLLSDFETADLTSLYVVTEFVFDEDTSPGTVCFRNIEYLSELESTPTGTPMATATSNPTATSTQLSIIPTNTATPLPPTATSAPQAACVGDSSAQLTAQAWSALGSDDLLKALACTQETIQRWTVQADEQQAMRVQQGICSQTPDPTNQEQVDAYWASYWAVNDVATNWFIRGEALTQQGQAAQAREAYQTVVDRYSCAYAFDPSGPWFWHVAEAAQGKLN